MNYNFIFEIQKRCLIAFRLVYMIFIFFRLLLEYEKNGKISNADIAILIFIIIVEIIEELLIRQKYFKKIFLTRIIRYIQCIFFGSCLVLINYSTNLYLIVISLFFLSMFGLIFTVDLLNQQDTIINYMSLAIPLIMTFFFNIDRFFDIIVISLVIFFIIKSITKYVENSNSLYWLQEKEIYDLSKMNDEIKRMQESLKENNIELKLQQRELKEANKRVHSANEEMKAQTDIMQYIVSSYEIPKISSKIIDTIMKMKKLGFCAVYIKEDVYMNKAAQAMIRTDIAQLRGILKNHIGIIFQNMINSGDETLIVHENLKHFFPFFMNINVNSVYVKILKNEDAYGLFMMGDERRNLFSDNLSFYDVIFAQYNIAVKNARIYNEMKYMAIKDGLTGINNRLHFRKLFNQTMKEVMEYGGNISVALLDIDKFKNINDTYGHLAGDEVIKRVAFVLEQNINKYDGFVCRYGGEEFVAALPNRKLEVAMPIIEELFEQLCNQLIHFNDNPIRFTVSIGVTSYPELCKNPEELLKRADLAMYYAKEHGRFQICVDHENI